MKNFQMIMLIVFVVGAVVGILVFSGLIPLGQPKNVAVGSVVLWGTIPRSLLADSLDKFSAENQTFTLKYVEKNPASFDKELLEALAKGEGPDMFILPDNLIFHYKDKILTIPYVSYPVATFRNDFAGIGEMYLNSKGVLALPLAIDPMIMYYNRSMFDANSITNPPATWSDVQTLAPILTKKDPAGKILKSGIGLGQFSNIDNAKDIISTMFMQAGSPIVTLKDDIASVDLNSNSTSIDLGSILSFYTSFADPLNPMYSWNKSLPKSQDNFGTDNLGIYFGYASELSTLTTKNPNLNFYIAPMPQIKNSNFALTFGHSYAIAISSATKNPTTAYTATGLLASGEFAQKFSNALLIAPARRSWLAVKPTDAYFPIVYNSALYARSWLDPSPLDTNGIFQRMVENVLSNNMSATDAVSDASSKLGLLLQ